MNLGETIYRLRTEQKMSQGDLADALGVSRQSISKWETNSSVPELDKLIKLSHMFGVSMDELILGKQNVCETEAEQKAAEAMLPAQDHYSRGRKIAGIILLCCGALVWLLFTINSAFLAGLLFASPFILCGVICLVFHRNAGLWCAWAMLLLVCIYLRFATGVTWGLTLLTPYWKPSMNYMRLAIAWAELICYIILIVVTVLRFRRKRLPKTTRNLALIITGWAVFALSYIHISLDPRSVAAGIVYFIIYLLRTVLLPVLLTFSVRLISKRKAK